MKQIWLSSFLFVAVTTGGIVYGQNLNVSDQKFVREAAEGGMAEVKLGQLAQDKGESQTVKDFGSRMVADHTKAGDQLKGIASQKGMSVSNSLNAKDNALYNRLSKLSGREFDREYMRAMVQDHVQDVAAFRKESTSGSDAEVRGFASNTLPTLQDHLKMARDGLRSLGTSAAR